MSPDPATITAGGSQAYSAEGFDQFNNSRGDRTANTLLTIRPTADSSCEYVTHTCTSTVAADHTVTGTDAGAATTTDTATLHVNAAALDHIVISPDPATITAGGSQPYSAEGFDQFNNSRGDRTANTLLTISPTAGSSCEDVTHTCTSTVASDHTVTGTDAGAATTTDTATLHVTHAEAQRVALSGLTTDLTSGATRHIATATRRECVNTVPDGTGATDT